jgi:hypothetical protein
MRQRREAGPRSMLWASRLRAGFFFQYSFGLFKLLQIGPSRALHVGPFRQ